MEAGFAKVDITPRIGIELCGFGAYLQRRSIGVRDRLWARALALRLEDATAILVSCDLVGLSADLCRIVRKLVCAETCLPPSAVMVHCTHTHSGPATAGYEGWGQPDQTYLEILPRRIAAACTAAFRNLQVARLSHAEVPCEHIGLNREYDRDAPPLDEVLQEDWRPAKPELTDTTCHVLAFHAGDRLIGFASYFGCHPVVCCEETRYIHGDFVGIATASIEREQPGSIGLFLQGAQGDVNSCVVHKPERESLLALDVVAARYARAVRAGLEKARPLEVDRVACALCPVDFTPKRIDAGTLKTLLAEYEAVLHDPRASDESSTVRMATVNACGMRKRIADLDAGVPTALPADIQAIRIGPVALLACPFEVFQAIKNDVRAGATSPIPLVMGITNGVLGYAPDRTTAAKGGYAADVVPLIIGSLPCGDIHTELVEALLAVEKRIV